MIWESYPWKEELHRIADRLEKKTRQSRWTERTDANLEKDVFVGFYAVRKLMEARKLSVDVVSQQVRCKIAPLREGKRITHYNWHKLDELYDFDRQGKITLSLRRLCNQFIHSYVFCSFFDESGFLHSVAVASDRKRNECIQIVPVASLIDIMRAVGSDIVTEQRAVWDEKIGDYRITNR